MLSKLGEIWKSVEQRNITLFYVAGALMLIPILEQIAAKLRLADLLTFNYISLGSSIWTPLASIFVFLALLGLFHVHTDRAPRSAKNGAVLAGIAILIHFILMESIFCSVMRSLRPTGIQKCLAMYYLPWRLFQWDGLEDTLYI